MSTKKLKWIRDSYKLRPVSRCRGETLTFSPHGLRSTAATLLREHGFGRDVVELLLAHSEKNATVAAYSHMELAGERRRALQFLSDRIEELAMGSASAV